MLLLGISDKAWTCFTAAAPWPCDTGFWTDFLGKTLNLSAWILQNVDVRRISHFSICTCRINLHLTLMGYRRRFWRMTVPGGPGITLVWMLGFRRTGLFDAILVHGKHDVIEETCHQFVCVVSRTVPGWRWEPPGNTSDQQDTAYRDSPECWR